MSVAGTWIRSIENALVKKGSEVSFVVVRFRSEMMHYSTDYFSIHHARVLVEHLHLKSVCLVPGICLLIISVFILSDRYMLSFVYWCANILFFPLCCYVVLEFVSIVCCKLLLNFFVSAVIIFLYFFRAMTFFILVLFFKSIYLIWERESRRESEWGGAERAGKRGSQAGSTMQQ